MSDAMMESGNVFFSDKEERVITARRRISPVQASTTVRVILDQQNRKYVKKGRRKSGSKKHRAGRYRKRKYKPYHKMTFSEKQKLDARIAKRVKRKFEYYHSRGLPLAPPNTNQFLLQDRLENSSSDHDEFMAMWDKEISESYQYSTDQELRERYIELEDEVARQEKEKEDALTKIRIFQDEVRSLEGANEILSKLNAGLSKVVDEMHFKVQTDVDKNDLPLENCSSSADM